MKKNAILFSASNYTKSPLIQIDDLPGVKYDIQQCINDLPKLDLSQTNRKHFKKSNHSCFRR